MSDHTRDEEDAVRTPAWLPVLGVLLFLCLVIYMLVQARPRADATVEVPSTVAQPAHRPAPPAAVPGASNLPD